MATLLHERLTQRTNVRLSDAQAEALDHIARQERRHRTDIVRFAIEEYLERRLAVPRTPKESR